MKHVAPRRHASGRRLQRLDGEPVRGEHARPRDRCAPLVAGGRRASVARSVICTCRTRHPRQRRRSRPQTTRQPPARAAESLGRATPRRQAAHERQRPWLASDGFEDPLAQGSGRLELGNQRRRVQPRPRAARRASAAHAGSVSVLFDAPHVLGIGGVERTPAARSRNSSQVSDVELGHHRSLHSTESSGTLRSCCRPRRMRVLIVPNGTDSSVATSNWVMPR